MKLTQDPKAIADERKRDIEQVKLLEQYIKDKKSNKDKPQLNQ